MQSSSSSSDCCCFLATDEDEDGDDGNAGKEATDEVSDAFDKENNDCVLFDSDSFFAILLP